MTRNRTTVHSVGSRPGITDWNWDVKEESLKLFKELFDRGHGFEEAIAAAKVNITDSDWGVRETSLKFFKELFVHGKGFDIFSDLEFVNKLQYGEKEMLIHYLKNVKTKDAIQEEEITKALSELESSMGIVYRIKNVFGYVFG